MNLYLLKIKGNIEYEMYDSAVVAAHTCKEALAIHPSGNEEGGGWPSVDREKYVDCTLIGKAVKRTRHGVICSSFNSG